MNDYLEARGDEYLTLTAEGKNRSAMEVLKELRHNGFNKEVDTLKRMALAPLVSHFTPSIEVEATADYPTVSLV